MTHSYVLLDLFMRYRSLVQKSRIYTYYLIHLIRRCSMTHSYVLHDVCMRVPCHIRIFGRTHSHV